MRSLSIGMIYEKQKEFCPLVRFRSHFICYAVVTPVNRQLTLFVFLVGQFNVLANATAALSHHLTVIYN